MPPEAAMAGSHLTLECTDVAAGATFFRDVLALPVRQRAGRDVEVDLGDVTATLTTGARRPEGTPAVIVEIAVDDLHAAIREMQRRGADVLIGPVLTDWGTESAFMAGPDGVVVELYRRTDQGTSR
jgi:catechol 2,3-dioxygenase-like lactoylglutathione lyase family enzyme